LDESSPLPPPPITPFSVRDNDVGFKFRDEVEIEYGRVQTLRWIERDVPKPAEPSDDLIIHVSFLLKNFSFFFLSFFFLSFFLSLFSFFSFFLFQPSFFSLFKK
jgi:hypothetical protein